MEKTKNKNYVYKGRILNVRSDDVLLDNGKTAKREVVEHNGGCCVLAVTADKKIIFVRQYRYAVGEYLLELPAGKLEKGEDPQSAIRRELKEETGYTGDIHSLGSIYPTCGYSSEIIYLYYADNLKEGATNPDEDEFLNIEKIDIAEALTYINSGEIKDAKTIIAVYKYISFVMEN